MSLPRYKFRAEGLCDVVEFLSSPSTVALHVVIEQPDWGPDVTCEFNSPTPLQTLKQVMGDLSDGHVMRQTLELKENYTGERKENS